MISTLFPQFKCFRVPVTALCPNWVRHHPRPHGLGCWLWNCSVGREEMTTAVRTLETWRIKMRSEMWLSVDSRFFFFFESGDIRTSYIQEQRYFTYTPRFCAKKSDTHCCPLGSVFVMCKHLRPPFLDTPQWQQVFTFLWADLLINKFHLSLRPQSEIVLRVLQDSFPL